ncbi:MAG: hypothetical protein U1F77_07060 [Kiritimatiellia bacterium]
MICAARATLWNQLGLHTGRDCRAQPRLDQSAAILPGWPRSGAEPVRRRRVRQPARGQRPAHHHRRRAGAVPEAGRRARAGDQRRAARRRHRAGWRSRWEAGWRYTILFSDDFRTAGATASWQPFAAQGEYAHTGAAATHTFIDDFTAASSGVSFPAHGYAPTACTPNRPP